MSLHIGAETHLIRETLGGLEAKLDPEEFVRDSGKWDQQLIARMKQNGIALVPTLKLFRHEG